MGLIHDNLLRLGVHGTRLLGRYFGEHLPLYYVCEYQKSGGTWLGQMIADALQIPFPQHPRLPVAHTAVIHNHWGYDPRLRRVFYLVRDGRDVLVSLWFHRMRELAVARERGERHSHAGVYERLFGAGFDAADARSHLARFLEHELRHPRGTRMSWGQHVEGWAFDRPHVVRVRYEDLLADTAGELARIIPLHSGRPLDAAQARATAEKFTFARQTGRNAGQEDRASFRRKGVAGDWVNHFSRETAERFEHHFGDTLRRLGYDAAPGWAGRLPV